MPIKYNVSIGTVSNGSVTLSSKGSIDYGTTITVTATPTSGYKLSKIFVNGTEISGTTFTVNGESEVTATFTKQSYKMTLTQPSYGTITVKDSSGNNYSDGATIPYGTKLTITLTPTSGYRVVDIKAGKTGSTLSALKTNSTISDAAVKYENYSVPANAFTISASNCKKIYQVNYSQVTGGTIAVTNDSTGAAISAGSYVDTGTTIKVTVTEETGYDLSTLKAGSTSLENGGTYKVTAKTTVAATYVKEQYKITISASNGDVTLKDAAGNPIASGDSVEYGTVIKVTATPKSGYKLSKITTKVGDITTTITSTKEFTVTGATTVTGTFAKQSYTMTITNPDGGTITVTDANGNPVETNTKVTYQSKLNVTLTPSSGYRVKNITVNGTSKKNNSTISNAAVTYEYTVGAADFTLSGTVGRIFTVSIGNFANGTISLSPTDTVDVDTIVTVTTIPATGYALSKIYVNGKAITGNTFPVLENSVVTAKFITTFEVEVFTQTVGSSISSNSLKNTGDAVSYKFTQATVAINTTANNSIDGKYGSKVTLSLSGKTNGLSFLGWYDKLSGSVASNEAGYERLLSKEENYVLSDNSLHADMQIVAVFTATSGTDTVFNFMNVAGQAIQTLVASKDSYVPVTDITAIPFKSGSVFTGWEFLKNAYKSTAVKKTLDPDRDGTTSTYYLIDGTTQPTYKYAYSILYKESSCATPLFIYVNGAGGEVNIDGAYTKLTSNKVEITVIGDGGKVNNASSVSVAYNTTVTATATGTGTFIGWIDKTNGTTRYSAEAFTTDNVTYYPYISYKKTFSFKALSTMTIQPVYGTSAGNKPNVSMSSVIQLQNNKTEKNIKYTAYGMFTATPGDGYEIVEWGALFFKASDAAPLPTTVITNASTGDKETANILTLETTGLVQKLPNVYEDNSNPSGQYAAGIKVASACTIYVRMYCTYSYTDASTGELKYAVTYSDTYVFSTGKYSSSTASGFVSNVTCYEEPSSSLDNSGAIELF